MGRAFAGVLVLCGVLSAGVSSYTSSVEQWRKQREAALKADDGWLTVSGLFWLKDGPNTAGSAPGNDIRLERGPAHFGVFLHSGDHTSFNGKPLGSDTDGTPDLISVDDYTMFVIHRGNRYAIRLKDKRSPLRREFTGLHWYPVREAYRVEARWIPYATPRKVQIPNILGETEEDTSPGYAEFTLNGQKLKLEPVVEDDHLFFIFRDQTAGHETYGSGRFLDADMPKGARVVLDFNKAYNPPCAFTPYATCPLPPPQNRLNLRIEAGELNYGQH